MQNPCSSIGQGQSRLRKRTPVSNWNFHGLVHSQQTLSDARGRRPPCAQRKAFWLKCEHCGQIIWRKALEDNLQVCPKCDHHYRIDARSRLALLFDDGQFQEFDTKLTSTDPLHFVDPKQTYKARLEAVQKSTHLRDAIISAAGKSKRGRKVHICALELKFIGGSMGTVVARLITRAIERSLEHHVPLIIVSASGGARMLEGAVSLMQLAKISAALMRLDEAKVPYISVLTDPTTGGVTASFAMLGDLYIAEPGALIGFAGPARHRANHPPETSGWFPNQRIPVATRFSGWRW